MNETIDSETQMNDDFLRFDESDGDDDGKEADQSPDGDERLADGVSLQTSMPPWVDVGSTSEPQNPLIHLHNEIVGFCKLMEPKPEELRQRQDLVEKFTELIKQTFGPTAIVDVFGSQVTGLCLPTSDIDIAVQLPKPSNPEEPGKDDMDTTQEDKDGEVKSDELQQFDENPLRKLGGALRQEWADDLSYLEVIENTRVPLVKFIMEPSNIAVDVCFDQDTGPKAAALVKQYMEIMPPLRPLTFVMKYFLASRALNQPYTGGVGSFMLQMMILSFLQHREREKVYFKMPLSQNLGAMLIDFLVLYSTDFNYITTGFTVRFDGMYFPKGASDRKEHFWQDNRPFGMAIENPLEPSADVGRPSFRIQTIQRSFEVAYKLLLAKVADEQGDETSVLASILPTTDEMKQRKDASTKRKR